MNVELVPAILEKTFPDIQAKLAQLEGLVNWVQIDVADGDFAPNVTWSDPAQLATFTGSLKLEIHLMTKAPESQIKGWLAVADRIIFHAEAMPEPAAVLNLFEHSLVQKVAALLLETPLETVSPYVDKLDGIQLMGIAEIGRQGHSFSEETVNRVRQVRELYPNLDIAVDGGVNLENIPALVKAEVNRLVVGSAFWRQVEQGGVAQAIHSFKSVMSA